MTQTIQHQGVRVPLPARLLPSSAPGTLLVWARLRLAEAAETTNPALRYGGAHSAAQYAASAVVAARAIPTPGSSAQRSPSLWTLLAMVAPEWAEWADLFASAAPRRAAADAGIPGAVDAPAAAEHLRQAAALIRAVELALRTPGGAA